MPWWLIVAVAYLLGAIALFRFYYPELRTRYPDYFKDPWLRGMVIVLGPFIAVLTFLGWLVDSLFEDKSIPD